MAVPFQIPVAASLLLLLLLGTLVAASPAPPTGRKTFVVLENPGLKKAHSQFFKSLADRGFQLTYATAGTALKVTEREDYLYDHLVLFAPSAGEFGGELTTLEILKFMKSGGNVLVAGAQNAGAAVKDLAYEVGIEFADSGFVVDHFSLGADDDGTHTLVRSDNLKSNKVVFHDAVKKPVLFKGIAHRLSEDNPLVFPLLAGSATSFAGQPGVRATSPHVFGKETGLVSALQARNNARIVVSGSLDLFSDQFFDDKTADNSAFADAVAAWTFHERGVLREVSRSHHRKGEAETPQHYIITETVAYAIRVEEWNGAQWVPFVADDIQLEARMLDPYIRTTLETDGRGNFTKEFKLPDVYGVFTFRVEYSRLGYTFLAANDVIPVRPLRHDMYSRFIGAAYPYYSSALSMMVGFFLFCVVFLYARETTKVKTQ